MPTVALCVMRASSQAQLLIEEDVLEEREDDEDATDTSSACISCGCGVSCASFMLWFSWYAASSNNFMFQISRASTSDFSSEPLAAAARVDTSCEWPMVSWLPAPVPLWMHLRQCDENLTLPT